MVISALLIALVFVATRFINIRLPIAVNGGLVHLGNAMLFVAAIVFGGKKGAIAGAFGMGLFDLLSEWAIWAPATFIIRGIMGYIIGTMANSKDRNGKKFLWNIAGIVLAAIWMVMGYYVAEGILYGNWIAPLTSILGNITQLIIGAIIGIPLAAALKKTKVF
nr:ECF transporter S component [Clostridium sp. KNHs214]